MFELKERDGLARICVFETKHGKIATPTLLPVINPNQIIISPSEMRKKFGTQTIITNAYIIYKNEKLRKEVLKKGIHSFLDFKGPIMTDSGTFQSYVYGKIDLEPLEIVEFQRDIGADIGTILDVFSKPDSSYSQVKAEIKETLKRAKSAVELKGDMILAGTIQGSTHSDLREYCAKELSKLDFGIHPIGGVVPLMEDYRFADLVNVIITSKKGLNPARPVHLFGAGHPMLFPLAVLLGCDFFDSASYAKYAREDRLMFSAGTKHLQDLTENICFCPVCSKYSIEELKALDKEEKVRAIAEHNLYVSFLELSNIKQAIKEGNLWELVERRCRTHPTLLSALRALKNYNEFLERYEPISRQSAFYYTGPESLHRPVVYRYQKRFFERYQASANQILIGFSEGKRPYHETYKDEIKTISKICDARFIVNSIFGPVPIELDEMYPIEQSVISDRLEPETEEFMRKSMERFSHNLKQGLSVLWEGLPTLEFLKMVAKGSSTFNLDVQRVKATADMQFGSGAGEILTDGQFELIKSKSTGRIRNILLNKKHILSIRASDGLFTLKPEGARLLHKHFKFPKLRVIVQKESAEFNRKGKNVFCKFVLNCDDELRPFDEVLVVDEKDKLVAVGQCLMNKEEMLAFKTGMAVKVRDGIN